MNTHEQRRLNDAKGLHFVHQFGWLRTAELGKLLWPNNASNRQAADRLARSWIERHLVIVRALSDGAGRALVLATAGVRLLAEHGIQASTGKDMGRFTNSGWLPPASWKHNLIAYAVLCELHRRGYTIYPESELRRREKHLAKIPDGFAIKGNQGVWLEVENARKSGKEMRQLAEALSVVASGQAVPVMNMKPTAAMVAFVPSAIDERGHTLSHQERVRHAIRTVSKTDISIYWAKCYLLGSAGVGRVEFETEKIHASRADAILNILNASGWHPKKDGSLAATYGKHIAYVWEDEGSWAYSVQIIGGAQVEANRVANITSAKRAAALTLAQL